MIEYKVDGRNLENLRKLAEVIKIEEDHEATIDDALKRVLEFYRRFVPYS